MPKTSATNVNKTKVGQAELRKIMLLKKNKKQNEISRVDAPFARYDYKGRLFCDICDIEIKSANVWPLHLVSSIHNQNVLKYKQRVVTQPTNTKTASKRSTSASLPVPSQDTKRRKCTDITETVSDETSTSSHNSQRNLRNLSNLASYDSDSDDEAKRTTKKSSQLNQAQRTSAHSEKALDSLENEKDSLPADFFDNNETAADNMETEEDDTLLKSAAESLPEGFFDDPKLDAKARNVEYIDKMDAEWSEFQKAIKDEAKVSEAIQEGDDDVMAADRDISEVDEQMKKWQEVDNLLQKKENITRQTDSAMQTQSSSSETTSEADDAEYEEFLDWRTKKSWL